jgi:hypothetical protein
MSEHKLNDNALKHAGAEPAALDMAEKLKAIARKLELGEQVNVALVTDQRWDAYHTQPGSLITNLLDATLSTREFARMMAMKAAQDTSLIVPTGRPN